MCVFLIILSCYTCSFYHIFKLLWTHELTQMQDTSSLITERSFIEKQS